MPSHHHLNVSPAYQAGHYLSKLFSKAIPIQLLDGEGNVLKTTSIFEDSDDQAGLAALGLTDEQYDAWIDGGSRWQKVEVKDAPSQ